MRLIRVTNAISNRKILISYANQAFKKAQRLQTNTAKCAGFDVVIEYGPEDIDSDFKARHSEILSFNRGNGLWLWKPYFVLKTLDSMNSDDTLFYCDSGACFLKSVHQIFEIVDEQDIWLSATPLKEKQFTKKSAFEKMGLIDDRYLDTAQIQAGFICLKKTDRNIQFVSEWLECCSDLDLISPSNEKIDSELDCFYAHREDQSILSLIAKKYDIKVYSDPTQFGKVPEKYKREGFEMVYYCNDGHVGGGYRISMLYIAA